MVSATPGVKSSVKRRLPPTTRLACDQRLTEDVFEGKTPGVPRVVSLARSDLPHEVGIAQTVDRGFEALIASAALS